MQRLISLTLNENGTFAEITETICPMTGHRTRYLVTHLGEGIFRSELIGAA